MWRRLVESITRMMIASLTCNGMEFIGQINRLSISNAVVRVDGSHSLSGT